MWAGRIWLVLRALLDVVWDGRQRQWMQAMKGYRQMTTPTPFPWQATAQLGRILIDFIETIAYRQVGSTDEDI
jgi:hypothetical protein